VLPCHPLALCFCVTMLVFVLHQSWLLHDSCTNLTFLFLIVSRSLLVYRIHIHGRQAFKPARMCDQATHDPIVEHRDAAEDNTAADDNATAEAEELQRLRSACAYLWGKWWDILVQSDSRLRSSIVFPEEVHSHHDSVRCRVRRAGFEISENTEASSERCDWLWSRSKQRKMQKLLDEGK